MHLVFGRELLNAEQSALPAKKAAPIAASFDTPTEQLLFESLLVNDPGHGMVKTGSLPLAGICRS